ncbi:MAG: FG-GAP repeat protein [Candidatus Thermoplasmatota archaeon]|nr:FG-GAP repeat protein [Candidatus Thermoplasmatota archaeon]
MAKAFSSDNKPTNSTIRMIGILMIVAVLVFVPLGTEGNEDLQVIDRTTGSTNNAKLGWNITAIGDINNDDKEDYAISAPGQNMVYVFQGPMSSDFTMASANWRITGPSSSNFGWSIAGLGDYDRDGMDDLIVGAPSESKAYVFKGRLSGSYTLTQGNANIMLEGGSGDLFGHSVAGIDYGNTTHVYAAVGAPRDDHFLLSAGENVQTGSVFLFNLTHMDTYHKTSVNKSFANMTFQGDKNNGWLGFSLANLGDVNLDGMDDLGIGDPYFYLPGNTDNGAVHLQFGKNMMIEIPITPSSQMDTYIHGRANSRFGWFIRGLEDVSSSQEEDFIVGAPFENGVGHAHLFYGRSNSTFHMTLSPTLGPDCEFKGENIGDRFGWSADRTMISGVSPYVITIGAPGFDNVTGTPMKDSGALYSFWSWGSVENTTTARSEIFGDAAGNNLGYSVAEVYYRATSDDDLRIIASSPFYGTGKTGKIETIMRNQLPLIRQLSYYPSTGNLDTEFRISVNYTDPEGDPPAWVEVDIYQDNLGSPALRTLRLNFSNGLGYMEGMIYDVVTKLPNSVLDKAGANKPLYMAGRARAVRGSIDAVRSQEGIISGPVVDGVLPSAPLLISVTGAPGNNLDEGTFMISFEWPEEDAGFGNTLGRVKKLFIALREGKNNPITDFTWNDVNPEDDRNNLSTGRTVIFRIFQYVDIEPPSTRVNNYIIGENDPETNPNGISLKKMENYSIALRAEDEVGNLGPLSDVVEVQTYWRRPDVPEETEAFLSDISEDDGKTLKLDWNPPQMLHGTDIDSYWIYISPEPRGNVSDIPEGPDLIINRQNNYDAFLFHTLDVTYYLDESGQKVDLEDGQGYHAAVLSVNWLNQHCGKLIWSDPKEYVINDNETPIALIKGLRGENHLGDGHHIRLTWGVSTDPKFVEYQIYGREYSYTDIDDASFITTISDRMTNELIINNIGGSPITQAYEYSFTVLVKDYNGHRILEVDPPNNTVNGIKTTNTGRDEGDYPMQTRGVSLQDKGLDGGGVLHLTWFQNLQMIETTGGGSVGFWQYNIYFSDEPIVDISLMEPYAVVRELRRDNIEIMEFEGEPLIDGKYYYAAVTTVDWDLIENPQLDKNNVDSDRPINQSDRTPPSFIVQNFISPVQNLYNITLTWTAVTEDDVQDFNYYWLQWTGKQSGKFQIYDRFTTTYTIEDLDRGSEYWINISVVDLNYNIGTATPSEKFPTSGTNQPPEIEIINIDINEEIFNLTDGGSMSIDQEEAYIVFFTGSATDDWTSFNRLIWKWNITAPGGQYIEKNSRSWDLEITGSGEYRITLMVGDEEGSWSEPWDVTFIVEPPSDEGSFWIFILIPTLIVVIIGAVLVVLFVLMSGKKSQQKQMLEQFEERRKDIETMEPIYTDIPTWTCDCGSTQVQIHKNATCSSCYQSHEAVPITGIDVYLRDHDLVLAEMKIDLPPDWQGQDLAIDNAKKDLEERKKRALESLIEEFAPWLVGTKYESEIPVKEESAAQQQPAVSPQASLHHHGAIIPGQMPPPSPTQPMPMGAQPIQPMPMGPPHQGQPRPIQPGAPRPYMPSAPQQQQRPQYPPQK